MKKSICFLFLFLLSVGIFANGAVLKDCVFATTTNDDFSISSSSAYVCDYYTGKVVYEKNANERKPIASMTKVVGLGIVFDEIDKGNIKSDDMVIASQAAADTEGSSAFLDAGSSYKVEDLIKSVIIASANDSMVALGEFVSGNEKSFVNRMNEYARGIGMQNSNFENATGLPSLNAYSTAKDITIAFKKIESHPIFQKYSKTWMDEMVHPSGRKTELTNTNKLIKNYDHIIGGKTGYTNSAKYCFVGSAKMGDNKIISSILGAENSKIRFKEVKEMFDYAFANYSNKKVVDDNVAVCTLNVKNAKNANINVFSSENLYNFQKNNEISDVQVITKIEELKAPLAKYSVVGKVYLIDKNGVVVAESNAIIKDDVQKEKLTDCLKKIFSKW